MINEANTLSLFFVNYNNSNIPPIHIKGMAETLINHHQASDLEIRQLIENVEDTQLRMLFKYQYLTLGRISEVAGKYMPHRDDHTFPEVEGEEFVMFIVKTAKRKGRMRPCARPLSTEYDPWAREVLDYIESGDEYPFMLHKNHATSKTYAMNAARGMFKGLWWPMIDYTRSSERKYIEDWVVAEATKWDKKGFQQRLVVFPDGMRGWTKYPDIVTFGMKIEERWNPCTSHVIRKRGIMTLMNDYDFSGTNIAYFSGWTLGSQQDGTPPMLKTYMHMDLRVSKEAIPNLERQAKTYMKKLLIPYKLFI